MQTYNTDSQVGDSGACATALLCGVKGRFETVGLDDSARYDECKSSFKARIPCLADWAQAEGEYMNYLLTIRNHTCGFNKLCKNILLWNF